MDSNAFLAINLIGGAMAFGGLGLIVTEQLERGSLACRKVGGIWFLRCARLRFSFCIARA